MARYISHKPYYQNAKILIAPVGTGEEVKFLEGISKDIYGIDVSSIALFKCPGNIITKEVDIQRSGYEDEFFDIVICPLFLHHIHKVGYKPFITEYYRILRRGGGTRYSRTKFTFSSFMVYVFFETFYG